MNREEFIEKVKKQKGFIDYVDAFILTSLYVDIFGSFENASEDNRNKRNYFSVEDELIIMFEKIVNCDGCTKEEKKRKKTAEYMKNWAENNKDKIEGYRKKNKK